MEALLAIAFAALALFILLFAGKWQPATSWREHFSGIESALAILALVGAASWYFVARPDAAKINVDQKVVAYGLTARRVLVLTEVSIINVGARSLTLDGERYQYFLQQVSPLPDPVAAEVGSLNEDQTLKIMPGDKWAHFARVTGALETKIEAGEVENLYFRVVLACAPNLRVYSTIWIDRPPAFTDQVLFWLKMREVDPAQDLQWIKQAPLDLTEQCRSKRRRT